MSYKSHGLTFSVKFLLFCTAFEGTSCKKNWKQNAFCGFIKTGSKKEERVFINTVSYAQISLYNE